MDIAEEMLMTFNDDPDLLKKVITGDESWVYDYIETKKSRRTNVKCEGFAYCFIRLQWRDTS